MPHLHVSKSIALFIETSAICASSLNLYMKVFDVKTSRFRWQGKLRQFGQVKVDQLTAFLANEMMMRLRVDIKATGGITKRDFLDQSQISQLLHRVVHGGDTQPWKPSADGLVNIIDSCMAVIVNEIVQNSFALWCNPQSHAFEQLGDVGLCREVLHGYDLPFSKGCDSL